MSREEIYDVVTGLAIAALAYALWHHFKGAAPAAPAAFTVNDPTKPDTGTSYDAANPGGLFSLEKLLQGTVHDILDGSYNPAVIPTNEQIFSDVTGYDTPDSVVKVPGALW